MPLCGSVLTVAVPAGRAAAGGWEGAAEDGGSGAGPGQGGCHDPAALQRCADPQGRAAPPGRADVPSVRALWGSPGLVPMALCPQSPLCPPGPSCPPKPFMSPVSPVPSMPPAPSTTPLSPVPSKALHVSYVPHVPCPPCCLCLPCSLHPQPPPCPLFPQSPAKPPVTPMPCISPMSPGPLKSPMLSAALAPPKAPCDPCAPQSFSPQSLPRPKAPHVCCTLLQPLHTPKLLMPPRPLCLLCSLLTPPSPQRVPPARAPGIHSHRVQPAAQVRGTSDISDSGVGGIGTTAARAR